MDTSHHWLALALAIILAGVSGFLFRVRTIYLVQVAAPPSSTHPPSLPRIRIAILGAAGIASNGILYPARRVPAVEVVAIGARSPERARKFASRWNIAKYGRYQDILADKEVDAVYIALINGAHYAWAAAALRAGKHVLCEKPLTSNAADARILERLSRQHSLVLMEAYHQLHHPLALRLRELVDSGSLGAIEHLEVTAGLPSPNAMISALAARLRAAWMFPSIGLAGGGMTRSRPDKMNVSLGGGKFLGQGCYAVSMARFLLGEPTGVLDATMVEDEPGSRADVATFAHLYFAGGVTATLRHSVTVPMGFNVHATFTNGSFYAFNYLFPFLYHYLTVQRDDAPRHTEKHYTRYGAPEETVESTFTHQLRAFAEAVHDKRRRAGTAGTHGTVDLARSPEGSGAGISSRTSWKWSARRLRAVDETREPLLGHRRSSPAVLQAVSPRSAVRNMAILDAIYDKAGLGARPSMSIDTSA